MKAVRFAQNPLITPADVPPTRPEFEVVCVFNAGVAKYKDEIILLLMVAEWARGDEKVVRVPVLEAGGICIREFSKEDGSMDFRDPRAIITPKGTLLTSISHLRVARSRDGVNFTVDPNPALWPDRASEAYGLEDPRVTEIAGTYYIAYKSVAPNGICVSLATTTDWQHFEKKGIIFAPENLDVAIFPEKVNGRFVALHRPVPRMFGAPNMWVAYSPDLMAWGEHHFLMGIREDAWDSGRIGAAAVPIRTERGWLEIYHGATPDNHYCLGALLLAPDEPHEIIARGTEPILSPEQPYEIDGFVPNVCFSCGALAEDDRLVIYYGGADTVMAGCEISISELLESLVIG